MGVDKHISQQGRFYIIFFIFPIFDIYKSFSVLAVSLPIVMKQSALGSKLEIIKNWGKGQKWPNGSRLIDFIENVA